MLVSSNLYATTMMLVITYPSFLVHFFVFVVVMELQVNDICRQGT